MMRFASVLICLFAGLLHDSQAAETPNVVFILADDLGIMDVGAYATHLSETDANDLFYETPQIDALVSKGVAFSQAYANQLCSPTRAAILTGLFPSRIGVTTATPRTKTYYNQGVTPPDGYSEHDAFAHKDSIRGSLAWGNAHSNTAVSTELPTLAKVLASHDCAYLGKWHLGGHGAEGQQPRDHGFHEIAYYDSGASRYFNWRSAWDQKKLPFPNMPQEEFAVGYSGTVTGKEYLTDDLTDQAIGYLKQRAMKPEKPFFLYFAHFSVHTPLQAKEKEIAYFQGKSQKGINGQSNANYAAMVRHLDDSVGAIMKTLEETGLAENTIVVFFSDNGGVEYTRPAATDNFPFKGGKACLYEGGVRVPLVVYQPGKYDQGVWCDSPVNCVDLLPTFAKLTGNEPPEAIDGMHLVSLLDNPELKQEPRTFYWHYPYNVMVKHPDNGYPLTPHSAIRRGDYKLIFDWQGRLELYNIMDDPFEERDLSHEMPQLTQELFRNLSGWIDAKVASQYLPRRNESYLPAKDPRKDPFIDLRSELKSSANLKPTP